jgi:hypothetical protein
MENRKTWSHLKPLLFYSGYTNDLIKPAEEWGEEENILVVCNKFNISTTTYRFQAIISALDRSIIIDVLQLFNHCNLTSINYDMTILVKNIVTPFQGIIPVSCKKGNNSTITYRINPKRPAVEASTFVNWIQAIVHQYPTSIGEDITILVRIN